jgi:hypothetical protein
MTIATFDAWAIETYPNDLVRHGFLGRYIWFDGEPPKIPHHMEGCRVALFTTRRQANKGLAVEKPYWPNARVVRVTVTIQPTKRKVKA